MTKERTIRVLVHDAVRLVSVDADEWDAMSETERQTYCYEAMEEFDAITISFQELKS